MKNKWEKSNDWLWFVILPIIVISIILGLSAADYKYRKNLESQFDYKIKIMNSEDDITYYAKKGDIEIIDGTLFIKSNNIITTTFTITPVDKD